GVQTCALPIFASLASLCPSALPPLLPLPPAPGREGSRSPHSPRHVALASNFPRLSSLEYCRYHHARPAAPSSRFRTRLSGQHLDRIAVRDTNDAAGEVGVGRGDEQKNDDEDEKEYPFTSLASTQRLGVVLL